MPISRIWKRALVNSKFYSNVECGRYCKNYGEKIKNFKHITLNRRGTIRSAANAIDILKSTLFRVLKKWIYLKCLLDGKNYIWPFITVALRKCKNRRKGIHITKPIQSETLKLFFENIVLAIRNKWSKSLKRRFLDRKNYYSYSIQ